MCARHDAVFFMLYVIQSSQHPFEGVYFCFLFSDGETKTQRDWITSPRSHNQDSRKS